MNNKTPTNLVTLGLHTAGLHVSRSKKDPGVSDREISGLIDGGSYTSKARGSWSNTPTWTADGRQDMAAVFSIPGRVRLSVTGRTDIRFVHWLPGKPAEEQTFHCSFDKLS